MVIPDEQVQELRLLCPGVARCDEGGRTYLYLPGLTLPEGFSPSPIDALLCPTDLDGYPSRLFFTAKIQPTPKCNWNASGVRILEKSWEAFSWKITPGLRLAQMVAAHLKGLL